VAAELPIDAELSASQTRTQRNLGVLAAGQVVTWTMTLIWTFVVPRALGPAGMGIIVSAWSATGILGVVIGLGTRNYLTREMVVDPSRSSQLVGTAIVLRAVLAPAFLGAVFAYSRLAHYGSEGNLVLYLAGVATIFTLLAEPMQAGFQARERMEYLAYSDVINKSAQGLLGVVLVLLGYRSVGITGCWVAVSALVIVLNSIWLRDHFRVELRTSIARMRDMIVESLAYWTFGLFFMIYLWIDSVMLSLMTRSEVVGWYGVPTRLFQTMLFIPVIVSTAWLPRLVNSYTEGAEHLARCARAPIEIVLVLGLPAAAATAIGARPFIHLLYGGAYSQAVPVLVILGLCLPPMYLNIILSQVLIAAKRQVAWTWVMAGATVVNPLLNLGLISWTESHYHNGAIGASISLLITEALIVSVGLVLVGRAVLDRALLRRTGLVGLASAVMWAVAYAMRPLGTATSVGGAALSFAVLAVLFRLAKAHEVAWARAAAARLIGRLARRPRGAGSAGAGGATT
jgi:O-antigen/teichoic acid export membrane protein